MDPIVTFAVVFAFALLRYLPVMVLPGLSPLSWAPAFVRIILLLAFTWLTVLAMPHAPVLDARGWPVALLLGALGELLIGLARMLENDVSTRIKSASALFEPIMILLLGGMVGLMVLAVLLPIFEMSSLIG